MAELGGGGGGLEGAWPGPLAISACTVTSALGPLDWCVFEPPPPPPPFPHLAMGLAIVYVTLSFTLEIAYPFDPALDEIVHLHRM